MPSSPTYASSPSLTSKSHVQPRLTPNILLLTFLQIVIDTSSSSSPLSSKSKLNTHCRSIGTSYIAASIFGLFGAVFVDEGSLSATFASPESFTVSSCQAHGLSKMPDGRYRFELRTRGLSTDRVFLSTRLSGTFKPNLHHSFPHETDNRGQYEQMIEAEDSDEKEKEPLRQYVADYFDADYSIPCPLEGLEFPATSYKGSYEVVVSDPYDILDELLPKIKTVTPITTSITLAPKPLSYYAWTSLNYDEAEDPSIFPNVEAEIHCFAPEMIPLLSTYTAFLRHHLSEPGSSPCLNASKDDALIEISEGVASTSDALKLWNRLKTTCKKLFVPTEALISSVVATEALKIATKSGIPLNQWMLFDAPEMAGLISTSPSEAAYATRPSNSELQLKEPTPSIQSLTPPINDDVLLFPPSRHSTLSDASIIFSGFNACLELTSQNLALSGVCSHGKVSLFPAYSHYATPPRYQHQLDQSLLWKSSTVWQSNSKTSIRLEPSQAELDGVYARPRVERLFYRSDCDVILAGHEVAAFFDEITIGGVPVVQVWLQSDTPLVTVDSFVPHLSAQRRPTWSSESVPTLSWIPSDFPSCLRRVRSEADHFITSSAHAATALRSFAIPGAPSPQNIVGTSFALQWLDHPRRTLIDCVQWASDWVISTFVHTPKKSMQDLPLLRARNGKLQPFKNVQPHRSLSSSIINEGDPAVGTLVVIWSLVTAMQSGILPFKKDDFAACLTRYYSSMQQEVLDILKTLPTLTYSEFIARGAQQTNANTAADIQRIQSFALAPDFEAQCPASLPSLSALDGTQVQLDLIFALTTLESRVFGLGDFPLSLVDYYLNRATLPTALTAASALSAMETMKHLLSSAPPSDPSSSSCFRDYFLNVMHMELRPAPLALPTKDSLPNGQTWTEWDVLHLYASRSVTAQDLVDMLEKDYGFILNGLFDGIVALWISLMPLHRHRLHVPIVELMPLLKENHDPYDRIVLAASAEDLVGNDIEIPRICLHFTDSLL